MRSLLVPFHLPLSLLVTRYGGPKLVPCKMELGFDPLALLLRLVAVPAGAPGSSATGPGALTVWPPRAPLSMDRLQVQWLTHTDPVSAVLCVKRHKHTLWVLIL